MKVLFICAVHMADMSNPKVTGGQARAVSSGFGFGKRDARMANQSFSYGMSNEDVQRYNQAVKLLHQVGFGTIGEICAGRLRLALVTMKQGRRIGPIINACVSRRYGLPVLRIGEVDWYLKQWLPMLFELSSSVHSANWSYEVREAAFAKLDYYTKDLPLRRRRDPRFWQAILKDDEAPNAEVLAALCNAWLLQSVNVAKNSQLVAELVEFLIDTRIADRGACILLLENYVRSVLSKPRDNNSYGPTEVFWLYLAFAPKTSKLPSDSDDLSRENFEDFFLRLPLIEGLRFTEVFTRALVLDNRNADADVILQSNIHSHIWKFAVSPFGNGDRFRTKRIGDISVLLRITIFHYESQLLTRDPAEFLEVFERQFGTVDLSVGSDKWQQRILSRQEFLFAKDEDICCRFFCAYADCLRRAGRISDAKLIISIFVSIARQRAGMPQAGRGDGAELVPGIGPVAKATFTHTLSLLVEDDEGLTEAVRMFDDTYQIAEYEQLRFDKLFFNGQEGAKSVCEYARMLIDAERTFDAIRVLSSVLFPVSNDRLLFRESDVVNSLKLIGLWLQVQGNELNPMRGDQRCSLVGEELEAMQTGHSDSHLHPLIVCAQTMIYVRRAFESRTLSLVDLRHLVSETDVFRRHVVQVAFYWAEMSERAGHSESSRMIKQWAIVWDLELRQRLLFQRLRLLGHNSDVPPSDKHILPTDWPYSVDLESSLVKEITDHGRGTQQKLSAAMSACLQQSYSLAQSEELKIDSKRSRVRSNGLNTLGAQYERQSAFKDPERRKKTSEREKVIASLDAGWNERSLPEWIGSDGVLLRITIDAGGHCVWWLLAPSSIGSASEPLAEGRSERPVASAVQRILLEHEVMIYFAFNFFRKVAASAGAESSGHIRETLQDLIQFNLLSYLSRRKSAKDRMDSIKTFFAELELSDERRQILWPLFDVICQACEHLQLTKSSNTEEADCFLTSIGKALQAELDDSNSAAGTLQRTTSRLLTEFSALIDLTPIKAYLSPDKTHLVVSTDGVLNGIPWSCVLVDGKQLCFHVASIRCSLSPLIDRLLTEHNRSPIAPNGVKERVLVVSSFRENNPVIVRKQHAEGHSVDLAALLALILHDGHKAACGDSFRYQAAAEQQRASAEWLIREL